MKASHLGTFALALLLTGCGGGPTAPFGPDGSVAFDLTLSSAEGGPDHPIVANAVISNWGLDPVLRGEGCTGGGVSFSVIGPQGSLLLSDPCAPIPLFVCPVRMIPMHNGETLEQLFPFGGTYYDFARDPDAPCAAYQAPEGDYEIVARFVYYPFDGEGHTIERRARFHWIP